MATRACVVFPVYFTLTDSQELEYNQLASYEERVQYLFDLAGHYLQTSSVEPVLEYIDHFDDN